MRLGYPFFLYLFFSLALIVVQTSLIPATSFGKFTPDLNLIIIIFIAIRTGIPNPFVLAGFNGFLMDIFSGGPIGFHTLTRLAVFLSLKIAIRNMNYDRDNFIFISLSMFIWTLLLHLLLFAVSLLQGSEELIVYLSVDLALYQAAVNTAVGVPIAMLLKKLNGITKT